MLPAREQVEDLVLNLVAGRAVGGEARVARAFHQ